MKILVSFALENEFAPWRRLRTFTRAAELDFAAFDTKVGAADVRVALTGVGPERARSVIARALQWGPNVCISSGVAGSLRATYRVGEVFVAREVMELESGRTIAANRELAEAAERRGVRLAERLLSSANMVVTAEGKNRLGRMAEAVEMESFAVLTEAARRKIPAVAIRAISDGADRDLPMDFSGVLDDEGKVQASKMARSLARAPHKLPALLRLGRDTRLAATKLAEFLDGYILDLAARVDRSAEMAEATRA
ncbi:MAG: phosphorylase family protein [Candidatus Acidiferrales bacterium]